MKRITHMMVRAAALLPLAWTVACVSASPDRIPGTGSDGSGMVETMMAISLKTSSGRPGTKMQDSVTQASATTDYTVFRGIEQLVIIPFATRGPVSASDPRLGRNLELPHTGIAPSFGTDASDGTLPGLVLNNNSHLYRSVYVKSGTSSVLAYGKAIDDQSVAATPLDSVDFKRRNGVLLAHGTMSAQSPADISFTLEPFISSAQQVSLDNDKQQILTYLNNIAAASVSVSGRTIRWGSQTTWTYTWSNSGSYNNHQTLVNAFATLTGSGLPFSGSTNAIEQMLTDVYNSLYSIANSTSASSSYSLSYYPGSSGNTQSTYYYVYQLARDIRNRIANSTYVNTSGSGNNVTISFNSSHSGFPSSYGVPEGAVALEWNGSEFAEVSAASSTLAPIDAFCYPPSLWYWTNSTVKTSKDNSVTEEYTSSNATWGDILSNYVSGSTVLPGVLSTAIKEPLQYGVAQLRLRFNFASSAGGTNYLLDSHNEIVYFNNSNFPFTGIIIGEQRDLNFNFTPASGNNYVYDSDVYDNGTPKAWIASSDAGLSFKPVHTLVVQTDAHENVHYALEFRNDSGSPFYGVNGCVVAPGSRFYLTGILSVTDAVNNSGEPIASVFVQDRVTEVIVTVNGLAKAYNTIPELRDPQLEIGVQTEMKWVGSTPANLPMY